MNKQKVYVLIGLPGSGKSIWTEKKIELNDSNNIGVVSRDAIRLMINGNYKYIPEQQQLITKIMSKSAEEILEEGWDLIIDQTNISKKIRKEVTDFLRNFKSDLEIWFIQFNRFEIESLVQRRMLGDSRGENEQYHRDVINKMIAKYEPVCTDSEDFNYLLKLDHEGKVAMQINNREKNKNNNDFNKERERNLNITIAEFIYPRLKAFRKYNCGVPSCFTSKTGNNNFRYQSNIPENMWNNTLDKMILAFDLFLKSRDNYYESNMDLFQMEKESAKIEEGLNLFIKYFGHLWW